jgi:aldoxime dehydratase
MMRTHDEHGAEVPEDHALGHFLSLRHMERRAEGHATHAAIFGAAISRYRRCGASNQLRTWHEVFILP